MAEIKEIGQDYIEYLRDESRMTGSAETISFPESEEEVREQVAYAREKGIPVTLQGARTGITGGAVPRGGHILNVSRMKRYRGLSYSDVNDEFILTLEPGALLCDVVDALKTGELLKTRRGDYFFPPDPTETSASLGGMVSCNASGARTFAFGPTRNYVDALSVVLYSGDLLHLKRGDPRAEGLEFAFTSDSGIEYRGRLPSYSMPEVKSAAGLFSRPDMDLIDLFIGSEGTLGVITSVSIRLIRALPSLWGVVCFFPEESMALAFVGELRNNPQATPVALEFFSDQALALLRHQKKTNPAFAEIQEIPVSYNTAVYAEYHAEDDDAAEEKIYAMAEIMAACGGSEDDTWIASSENELARLKAFRHAIPEAVNLLIDERRKQEPGLTKLGTDMAVPDAKLTDVVALYREGLAGKELEGVMFGHIGNNHIHVNILPRTLDEYTVGKELYLDWADSIIHMGGTVSAEHGIGKLKTAFLEKMYGKEGLNQMKEVISVFNPGMMINTGNMVGNLT